MNGSAENGKKSINDSSVNGVVSSETWRPRDGGTRAWVVVAASFIINGLLFGVINSYSVIYVELQRGLEQAGIPESSSKASLVGSLTIGTTFALSPISGILTDRFGLRETTAMGGALAAIGMAVSSTLSDQVEALYFTYGILFGLGASLAYTPSLAVLGLHFRRNLGLVNGLVTAGSSVFTVIIPKSLGALIPWVGLRGSMQVLAILMLFIVAAAMLFKPPAGAPCSKTRQSQQGPARLSKLINKDIWRRKKYVIWALVIPLALFGYFVPYVHVVKFAEIYFPENDGKILIMCIGVTSGLGRLIFGKIADMPNIDRILLQQISFVSIGTLTMLLTVASQWGWMIVIALGMGLVDGCFISLLGPIAFDLCGAEGATQAIGFLLGLCSIPLTLGPPVAGMIYDHTGSYHWPFLLAGVPPIVGAVAMFATRCVPAEEEPIKCKEMISKADSLTNGSTPLTLTSSPTSTTSAINGSTARASEATSLLGGAEISGGGLSSGAPSFTYIERESKC